LNKINVNGWTNSEIVHMIREQNTEIAWALGSRKSHIQLPMFSKLHATVEYRSLERHSLDLCTVPAKISRNSNWRPIKVISFEVFSIGVAARAMVSPFLN
jgi:hypothetical protein